MIWKYTHSGEYVELVRQFPLAPITSRNQHEHAITVLEGLAMRDKLTPAESDYFDVLSDLIRKYEDKVSEPSALSPQEMLGFLMDQHGLVQADISRLTGVQRPHISEFFSGKRSLPRAAASKLGGYFKMDPAAFLPKIEPVEILKKAGTTLKTVVSNMGGQRRQASAISGFYVAASGNIRPMAKKRKMKTVTSRTASMDLSSGKRRTEKITASVSRSPSRKKKKSR